MGSSFCLGFPHQARVLAPFPEVHAPGDPRPDLLGLAVAQRLRKNDVGKDKGYFRVPTNFENPLPFRVKDYHEVAPNHSRGRGVPAR